MPGLINTTSDLRDLVDQLWLRPHNSHHGPLNTPENDRHEPQHVPPRPALKNLVRDRPLTELGFWALRCRCFGAPWTSSPAWRAPCLGRSVAQRSRAVVGLGAVDGSRPVGAWGQPKLYAEWTPSVRTGDAGPACGWVRMKDARKGTKSGLGVSADPTD